MSKTKVPQVWCPARPLFLLPFRPFPAICPQGSERDGERGREGKLVFFS